MAPRRLSRVSGGESVLLLQLQPCEPTTQAFLGDVVPVEGEKNTSSRCSDG